MNPLTLKTLRGTRLLLPLVFFALVDSSLAQSNPIPFINQPLVPDVATPGGPGFTLTVNGTGFVPGSVVNWNGSARPTSFVSASRLTATVLASDIVAATTAVITVGNPGPGGRISNPQDFEITSATPSISLNTTSEYSGGQYERWIATGDFNNDGKTDLAVTDELSGTVSIFLGNGDGTFQAPTEVGPITNPVAVVAGDFNADGNLDLAVSDDLNPSTVYVFLGNGDGTFQLPTGYAAGVSSLSMAVGDFNGDDNLDLAIANQTSNSVSVLLGKGDGTFQTHVDYATAAVPAWVTVGDFNMDGKLDLATANRTDNTVSILLGNGDGTFQAHKDYPTGTSPIAVAAADFNGDGILDLAVANQNSDSVSILLGNGDGSFRSHTDYPGGSYSYSISVGDLNGDGNLDLVVTSTQNTQSISVLLGNGDGTFQAASNYTIDTGSPFVDVTSDFNSDGRPDVAVATSGGVVILLQVPIVTLSSTNLTFSDQSVGTASAPQTVTLSNTGSATLTVSSINVTGSDPGDFSQTNNCGTVVNALGSCTINVTFSPTAPGTRSASISITDNAAGSPQTVTLSGTGTQPAAAFVPTSLNFGNQTVGMTSLPQTATLTNSGNGTLTVTGISASGNNGTFGQTTTCGSSLAPGRSCTVTLNWTPSRTGNMTGSLTFTDNAPGSTQTVPLAGVGVLPAVALSPTSLTFPAQVVFTTSNPQTVTLTDSGSGTLLITSITVTGNFSQTNTCGTSVAAGASCTFSVTFRPTVPGSQTGTLSIKDNAPGSPQTVSMSGMGTYIQLLPTSLNFGNQPVGTKSLPGKITLTNKGSVTVNLTSITIAGTNAADFSQKNTCGKKVAAGASCFITVTFTPKAKGTRTASLSVSDNGGGSPQTVGLAGTGT